MSLTPKQIITRFPPSPTGLMHIGTARTALFNYIFTQKMGGKMLFRLEDTDKERSKKEYEEDIISATKWLGLSWDNVEIIRQSERGAVYEKYIQKLVNEGKAYVSAETPKEAGQRTEVIRFKNPNKKVAFDDMIRGTIEFDTTELGDFVIAKSLSEPLYHVAVVIDDFEMGVTHIIRGEDHISNTPRQILLQEAIGAPRPTYAHIPLILSEKREKLSKRKHGEMVSVNYYRKQGYLPEAFVNFLAFLGWNPGTDKEVYSLDEIIGLFDIAKVQKGGAIFNVEKLKWMNKEYIKRLPVEMVAEEIQKRLAEVAGVSLSKDVLVRAIPSIVDRISVLGEISSLWNEGEFQYFFIVPQCTKEKLLWKQDTDLAVTKNHLTYALGILEKADTSAWSGVDTLKALLWSYAEEKGRGSVLWPIRYALSGKDKSPDPFTLLFILGREESLARLKTALGVL